MTPVESPANTILQASARIKSADKLLALGARLTSLFGTYERDRRLAELRWAKNARQFLGIYDPDVERGLDKARSKAYPKLTRVKCVSMLSRLMNLLFPSSEKNWSITCSKVPNLSEADLQLVLNSLQLDADPETPLEDQMIEMAIVEFAKVRSENLSLEIEDQLQELGGDRQVDYVSLCRKVLMSGIIYGMGVLKGPFARTQQQRTWSRDPSTGLITPTTTTALRPQFEFTALWDYYPDMSAKYLHQMDGQFQRAVMSRRQVRELADRDDFFGDVIMKYLEEHPKGNYRQRTYETDLKSMGVQEAVSGQDGRKYECIIWDGYISGHEMAAAGFPITQDKLGDQVEAIVWMLDGEVIKADMSPWVQLDVGFKVNTYHHFVFEEDESTITGNGLPNIMRDSQMAVAGGARMLQDNASVTCGPQLEVNTQLMAAGQDLSSIHAYKVWYRDDMGADMNTPAIKEVRMDSHMDELLKVIKLFKDFADEETFVGAATGGDMQKGPSEPFRTATGASMLRGDAALPFKDVVRNFDLFTQSVLGSMVAFNMMFNPKRSIQGDHQVIPRGATSLIAKEVRGMILDGLAMSLTPEDARYLNRWELLRERLAVRDVDLGSGIMCSKAEGERRDADASAAQKAKDDQIESLLRAEVRKTLADAVKALTQSDKNAAAADSTTAKTQVDLANNLMGTLEGEVSDDQGQAPATQGGGAGRPPSAVPASGRRNGPSPLQAVNNPLGAVTG